MFDFIPLMIYILGIAIGFFLGYKIGKNNIKLVSIDRNLIEIEVDTRLADAKILLLKKDIALLHKELERVNLAKSNLNS